VSDTNGGAARLQALAHAQLMVLAQSPRTSPRESECPAVARPEHPAADNITVNVGAKQLGGTDFEVELRLKQSRGRRSVMFNIELVFAGAFRIQNIPQEICSRC